MQLWELSSLENWVSVCVRVCMRVCEPHEHIKCVRMPLDTGEIMEDCVTCIYILFVQHTLKMSIKNQRFNPHTIPLLSPSRPLMLFSPFHPLSECSDENPCEGLSRHATFDNFGMAFLTLFRVSTGDNWSGIMKVDFLFFLLCSAVAFKRMRRRQKLMFVSGSLRACLKVSLMLHCYITEFP